MDEFDTDSNKPTPKKDGAHRTLSRSPLGRRGGTTRCIIMSLIIGNAAALLVEVANGLTSEGRRDLDGTVSELQCGISYCHGQDYIRICDGRNHFSTFFSLFFQVAGQDINSQI